ncbi:hypothetical protein Mapa_004675 [Marchantia paleacea]|nr:hypothetical protein Mapa_004675 [Marchantia paleacea]
MRRKDGDGKKRGIDVVEGAADHDDRRRLSDLIDVATNSPRLQLDDRSLTSIKAIVRRSDANVHAAFDLLYDKLKKNHSQVRYLGLLLMDELFTRSKVFRSLLVPMFESFLLLSVGFRSDCPLPPPQDRATLLRKKSIEVVEKWNDMFGPHYKPIRLAYDYLRKTLRFEFPNAREVATFAQQQRKEREQRTQELLKKKLTTLKDEYPDLRAEIHSTLDQVTECLAILHDNEGEGEQAEFHFDNDEDEFEEYGARSLRDARDEAEAQDTVPHETGENTALFDTLRDLYRLLTTRHLVNTQEWLSTLIRVDPEDERQRRDTLLRDIIDLRNKLLKAREICEAAGMERTESGSKSGAAEDMDDIIWEEGDVLISNSAVSDAIAAAAGPDTGRNVEASPRIGSIQLLEEKVAESKEVEETSLKGQLLKQAPVLKWGAFLERWGSDSAVPVNNRGLEFESHWGKVDYDVMIPAEKLAESNLRSVYYSAEVSEIQPCLAPLRKGGLCQRRDLKRCPFHGPIIPRDSAGNPLHEKEQSSEGKSSPRKDENTDDVVVAIENGLLSVSADLKDGIAQEDLAKQAVANVRQKDEESRKKIVEEKASVRRERAKRARQHNDSCLRAAAIATTSQGFAEAFGEDGMPDSQRKKSRGGLTALLRKKPTVKDRLSRRLLNGRVRDATVSQLAIDQEAAYRESFPNQW